MLTEHNHILGWPKNSDLKSGLSDVNVRKWDAEMIM